MFPDGDDFHDRLASFNNALRRVVTQLDNDPLDRRGNANSFQNAPRGQDPLSYIRQLGKRFMQLFDGCFDRSVAHANDLLF